jgi:hypothetical protein
LKGIPALKLHLQIPPQHGHDSDSAALPENPASLRTSGYELQQSGLASKESALTGVNEKIRILTKDKRKALNRDDRADLLPALLIIYLLITVFIVLVCLKPG